MAEHRNRYKGAPPRPWIRVILRAADGTTQEFDLIADTGNPLALIVGLAELEQFEFWPADPRQSNFGVLKGGLVQVEFPELGFEDWVIGYGSDDVVKTVQRSSRQFGGLAGLPLLRMFEYGGDHDDFWLRASGG